MQTVFGSNIEFSMRTFLFKTQGSSAEEQQQTISCNLHLDPAADVSTTEPDDCSCYSEEECSGKFRNWPCILDLLISEPAECAILYDGKNQSGAVENIPVGEFEHARDTNANGDTRMILGDRSESVYVYPVRAQVFAFWWAYKCGSWIMTHDDPPFLTRPATFDF